MKVVVVGCGRVGAFLAGLLDAGGHTVIVIDIEAMAFDHLPLEFKGTTLLGNGSDLEVLRQAGIEDADAFLALTEGDNRNLMSAQIANRIFGVKRVTAKVNDPIRARIYRDQGIATFSRTTILGTLLHGMLTGDDAVGLDLLDRAGRYEDVLSGTPVEPR